MEAMAGVTHARGRWPFYGPLYGLLSSLVCGLLAGCPSEEGAQPASRPASAGTGTATPGPAKPPKHYLGMMSLGGTIALTLDAPAPGRVTLRFADSPFGLHGSVVGHYMPDGDGYVVTSLEADAADPPPGHVVSQLGELEVAFRVEDDRLGDDRLGGDRLGGDIANLPASALPGAARLAGLIHATSLAALPAMADIAGDYAFVMTHVDRAEGDLSPVHGSNQAAAGQARITADGRLAICRGQDYRDHCTAPDTGEPAPGATLHPADQTRYPGAFELRADGEVAGRVFLSRDGDAWTLFIDQQQSLGGKLDLGAWVLRSARPLRDGALSGNWSCRQPDVSFSVLAGAQLSGAMAGHSLWIDGGTVATGRVPGIVSDLSLNAAFGNFSETRPASVGGLAHVKWFDPPIQPHTELIREQVLMPLGDTHLIYLNEMRKDVDSVVWGACHKM